MDVAIDVQTSENRKYVSASVFPPMRNKDGELGDAYFSTVKYAWRTKTGEWSKATRVHRKRDDGEVPNEVRRAALVAAIIREQQQAQHAQRRADDLTTILDRFDQGEQA